jgi:hypothetical protein
MSNGNSALPLALGAGGGFLLWYFLRDGKHLAHASAPSVSNANQRPSAPAGAQPTAAAASSPAAPSPAPAACMLRLDKLGLTADGARVGIAEAVNRCKLAGRADVTVTEDAAATTYADLMAALGSAGVLAHSHRNGGSRRNARARARAVADIDLATFARTVRSLADQIEPDPTPSGHARGRFGARKVFIAAIRRALRATDYARLSRAAIDELLLRAHRKELLELARADLVSAMDPDEVCDSEVKHPLGAQFHFVINERDGARNASTYRAFTLVTYTGGRKASSQLRRFVADPPTTWADARDRLGAAGLLEPDLAGRTHKPGGWMLSVDATGFRDELADPLPTRVAGDE